MQRYTHTLDALDIKPSARNVLVSIDEQMLWLAADGAEIAAYPVSTSVKPPSCVQDSAGTPNGLHRIARKIGQGAPLGAVFKGRVSIGRRYWELPEAEQAANLITTRILWLEGLEPGLNQGPGRDSRERYIYIHGTNHEDRIGQPASGGCVQLRNDRMIELFDRVEEGDHVYLA